jgi:hypothetical protein
MEKIEYIKYGPISLDHGHNMHQTDIGLNIENFATFGRSDNVQDNQDSICRALTVVYVAQK